ncbi:MAG: hypothetical protein A2Z15_05680 [Chloroflexi bacterium RBG_16_50_11]|nr:MAG: hypothetical protein A2Z15_05680 [Chloroflexi bacterium RBG_16_50_11]
MSTQLKPKPTFEEFIQSCTPLLKIPELEAQMRERVRTIVKELLDFQPNTDPAKNLKQFIQKDENFLGVLLALTNLSQEKFLRLLTAQRFAAKDYRPEWKADQVYKKIKKDEQFAETIARLFLEGRTSKLLAEQVADFYLDQLSLPENWSDVIRDENIIGNVVRKKLAGEYTDQKGEYIEKIIGGFLDTLQKKYGITWAHGQVALVGKEIDYAIPSLDDAYIIIMVSYMETTSSGQTARANEQLTMYQKIIGENVRYSSKQGVFINIVDGAGWLARRSDLRKLFDGCHYCLNMRGIQQLEAIILKYVPEKYFKNI